MQNFDFLFTHWKEIDQAYEEFSKLADLSCPKDCSSCCQDHHVHTSSFEMLPAAQRLYRDGKTDEILEAIESFPPNHCVLLNDHRCSLYEERPSMCRLFGMGRIENKNTFSICKIIKGKYPEKVKAIHNIDDLKRIKSFNQLYLPLMTQLPQGESEELPINIALKKAIEKVHFNSLYQQST